MQTAAQTYQLPMVQVVSSARQIQGQKLASLKGAGQTQAVIQIAIQTQAVIQIYTIVINSCQWSTIMRSNIFSQPLTEKMIGEQVLKSQDDYKEILKMFLVE